MEQENNTNNAILLMSGKNQFDVLPDISKLFADYKIEIINLNHYAKQGDLYARMELNLDNATADIDIVKQNFSQLAEKYELNWNLTLENEKHRIAVFVSKMDQHLVELITRIKHSEIPASIEMVISNHRDVEETVNLYDIPFHYIPIDSETREESEQEALSILDGKVDLIVLARYMQILTPAFVSQYENKIINIHHSLLPAFKGAKPYKKAYERGEKVIGATAHYVVDELDAGPIIYQKAEQVDHTFSVDDLRNLGSHIEKDVLVNAISLHTKNKVLLNGKRTIIL